MRILAIDTGSSSVKFSVFDMGTGEECLSSELERVTSIEEALASIPAVLAKAGQSQIDAVGQRVAHGGERFIASTLITPQVEDGVKACIPLAPLHNPPALAGIAIARKSWPTLPQVAVFDTAFHHAMPARASTYPVCSEWRKAGVRRYGFHGTSHQYIMEHTAKTLNTTADKLRIISCHLGSGASVCAINRGVSIDTSMGLTALEGIVMRTRCGDVDPGIYGYLARTLGLTTDQVEDGLYHRSGLAGLSGTSGDMRDIEHAAASGNHDAALALDVFCYRLRKYIGAYAAAMEGVDAITFTGGIGEHSVTVRERVCSGFEYFGMKIDSARNAAIHLTAFEAPQFQAEGSHITLLATRTREAWMIARETHQVLARNHATEN